MRALSFSKLFLILFASIALLFAASLLQAWTGPSSAPPAGNVAAPINVGSSDQIKSGGLGVNALAVYGTQYIQTKLGIGRASPVVALDVNGTIRIANGGEVCQSVTAGTLRYKTETVNIEYCDGSNWVVLAGTRITSGSQTYSSPGIYTFVVPAYNTLTVQVWGAGGGGGGVGDENQMNATGSAGGASSFNGTVVGNGGLGGRGYGSAGSGGGAGGSASGGDTNLTGGTGGNAGNPCAGSSGGASASGGWGAGGAGACASGGGGAGGYSTKTYTASQLTVTSGITVVVGAGGAGAGNASPPNNFVGASGASGRVHITWE